MKKTASRVLAILLSFLFIFQTSLVAFAEDEPDWEDLVLTQEEFDEIYYQNPDNQVSTLTSGLILSYGISIAKSGTELKIAGITSCITSVVKCGFTVVTIQRKKSTATTWSTYKTYEDLYKDASSYTLAKSITVPSGYLYRVSCTHYGKKSLFSTEKISNASNVISI